jgi:hypothetical protein
MFYETTMTSCMKRGRDYGEESEVQEIYLKSEYI